MLKAKSIITVLFINLLFLLNTQQQQQQYCPISVTECKTINCTYTGIYCEYDTDLVEMPEFINLTRSSRINTWTDIVIRNTNIQYVYSDAFIEFMNINHTIKTIDLSSNQIVSIDNNTFLPFKSTLKKLILTNNKIKSFQFEAYLIASVEQLSLDSNQLEQFNVQYTQIPTIKNLYLNNNYLNNVPYNLKYLNSLIYLDLSFNLFINLPKYAFYTLSNLRTLYLNGLVNINCVNIETFIGLEKLIELHLTAPASVGLKPDICWFTHLTSLKQFLYNTTQLLIRQNINLASYQFCNDYANNLCWLYVLNDLKNIAIVNALNSSVYCELDANVNTTGCVTGCSLVTCDPGSYNDASSTDMYTITTKSTDYLVTPPSSANQNLAVILGSVLGSLFLILLIVLFVVLYLIRKNKLCFKLDEDSEKNNKKINKNGNFNNSFFFGENGANGKTNNGRKNAEIDKHNNNNDEDDDDDDEFNNVGTIVNIIELNDNSLINVDETNENNNETNRNVRFDSNILVYDNNKMINGSNEFEKNSQNSSDIIETIYEEDENDSSNLSKTRIKSNNSLTSNTYNYDNHLDNDYDIDRRIDGFFNEALSIPAESTNL